MADPLSVAASVAGLVSLADIVVQHLVRYIREVQDAKSEVSALLREVSTLGGILKSLEVVVAQLDSGPVDTSSQTHVIHSCYTLLERLRNLLEAKDPTGSRRTFATITKKLFWPISKPESERLLKELERHKATLGLALEADSFSSLIQACSRQGTAVAEGFERIDASLSRLTKESKKATQILLNDHRRKILSFFGTVDPGKNQRTGMNLLHPGTGLWFTDGDEFKSWRDNSHSRLWIYGIPGAGKTILMARIIDHLEHDPVAADGLAYFYCDYKDYTTHNPIEIFGSIAKQFAVQHEKAFNELEELYKRHEPGTRQHTLTINELQSLITRQAAHFKDPCVLVDGLDECSDNRMSALEALVSLVDPQKNNIKVLLASRDEHDIRSSMESADFAEISIAAKSSDLKLYVLAEIERRTKTGRLNIRRPAVKEEIMAKLVDKAEGMFRWVSCQIDYLCELNSDKDRLEALNTLPPTLPKTYERILARVNDSGTSNQRLVRKTFQWLARMRARISPEAFAEALSIDSEMERLDPDCIIDENAVSKLCGSLVRRSVDAERLEFAHFTVEEFLRAIDPEDRQFAHYRLVGDEADKEIAATCLCYLNLTNFSKPLPPVEEMDAMLVEHRLLEYAALYWIYHATACQGEKSLESLIRRLFRPAKSLNFLYWAMAFLYAAYNSNQSYITKQAWNDRRGMLYDLIAETSVLHWASLLALPATVKWLLDSDVRCEQSSRLGYPIHFAAGSTAWLFNTIGIGATVMVSPSDQVATIELLSESGARVDLTGKEYPTPIQLAVVSDSSNRGWGWPAATAILKAGAPVHQNLFAEFRKHFSGWDIEYDDNSRFDLLLDTIIARDGKILDDPGFLGVAKRFGGPRTLEHLRLCKPAANGNEDAFLPNVELLRDAIKEMRTDAVKCLVQGQGQLPSIVINDKDALFHVVSHDLLEILRILLDHGMELTCKDQEENTLLHYAAETASSDMIAELVGRGLQVSDTNKAGKTPIMKAAAGKNLSGVEAIISIAEANGTALHEVDSDGQTMLHYAARGGSLEVLKRVYEFNGANDPNAIDSKGRSVLDMAVEPQSLPVVEFLLGQGLKPHEPSHQQMATLHRAILCASNGDGFKIVEMLVRGGASATSVHTDGKTPLHLLAESIHYQNYDNNLEDLLIRQGANINAVDSSGWSPIQLLCHAAINVNDRIGLGYFGRALNRLLSHGALLGHDENSVLQVVFDKLTILIRLCQGYTLDAYAPYDYELYDYTPLLEAFVLVLNQSSWNSIFRTWNRDGSLWSEILHQAHQISVEAILRKLEATPTENLGAAHFSLVREACIQGISRANFQRLVQPFKAVLDSFDHNDERIIHHAALASHVEILRVLLDLGIDVNTRTGNRRSTPLMLAAQADSLEALELLLAKGATIEAKDLNGYTVYHYACMNGHVRIMRRLDFDAAPTKYRHLRVRAYKDQGLSCLHLAARKGWPHAINYLLRNRKVEDINGATMHGFTSLHFAVQSRCHEAVTLLLDGGADLSLTTAGLESPLHLAARDGAVEIMGLLIEGRPDLIDAKNTHGATALHICSEQGHVDAVRCLLESGADASLVNSDGATAEHLAFLGRHERIMDLLREASPANSKLSPIILSTAVPSCGATPPRLQIMTFFTATESNLSTAPTLSDNLALWVAVCRADVPYCERLLEQGVNASATLSSCHCTPLLLALHNEDLPIASLLVAASKTISGCACAADLIPGFTPFHYAVGNGWVDILDMMLKKDSSISFEGPFTPIHLAAALDDQECLKLLLDRNSGSDANGRRLIDISFRDQDLDEILSLEPGLRSRGQCRYGGTALHMAVAIDSVSCVKFLIGRGANLELLDDKGRTPFLVAASYGKLLVLKLLERAGANIFARDFWGNNAILAAAKFNDNPEVLYELLRLGVSPTQTSYRGFRALGHALGYGNLASAVSLMCQGHRLTEVDFSGTTVAKSTIHAGNSATRSLITDFIMNVDIHANAIGVDMESRQTKSLLLSAYQSGELKVFRTVSSKARKSGLSSLLDQGSWRDFPPLLNAAMRNKKDFVEVLLEEGANINQRWQGEGPALKFACEMGHLEIVQLLVERGAQTSWPRGTSSTAMEASRYHQAVANWLQEHGYGDHEGGHAVANYTRKCASGLYPEPPYDHLSLRKRPSFELEYSLRRKSFVPTPNDAQSSTQVPHHERQHPDIRQDQTLSSRKKLERSRNRGDKYPVFAQAHDRWKQRQCASQYRYHALTPFVTRVAEGSPWTMW